MKIENKFRWDKLFVYLGILTISVLMWGFIFYSNANADICMDKDTAGHLIVEIEQSRINSDICIIKDEQIQILQSQILELKNIIKIKDEEMVVKNKAIKSLDDLIKKQKDDCNLMLKEAKPSFFKEVIKDVGFVGIGILIGKILVGLAL
jgi:hypothetical protein